MHNAKGVGSQFMLLLMMGLSTQVTAATKPQVDKDGFIEPVRSLYSYVITVSAGPTWASGGTSAQTFFLQPGIENTYTANNPSNVLADGELFVGVQRTLNSYLDGQLGLAVAGASNANLSGNIWEDANPEFNNFTYSYNVNHAHVAVKGKLLTNMNYVKPYLSASVGVGFNNAHSFTMTPTITEALPEPNFTSANTTSFTYTVGVGVQRELTRNWQVGIGYEFADWGKSQLGLAPTQTLGTGLSQNHLYTNGLMFNLTYVS